MVLLNSKNFKGFKKQSFLNRLEEQGSSKSLEILKKSQSKKGVIRRRISAQFGGRSLKLKEFSEDKLFLISALIVIFVFRLTSPLAVSSFVSTGDNGL